MEAFQKYLQNFPNFTPQVMEEVKPHLIKRQLNKGEYFLREGKICRSIAFIEQGLFRIYYLQDGREITHCFCKEHHLSAAYSSFITQSPSSTSIQALEDSQLLLLPYALLQDLYAQNPFWQQVGRMAAEQEYLVAESHQRFLSDLSAQERYQQILTNDPTLLQRVPLNYLASYLQITPETLSRIRNKISRT